MIRPHFFALFFSTLFLGACAEDSNTTQMSTNIITPGGVLDVGNTGNGSDLLVKFTLPDINLADQIQLVIIPASEFTGTADIDIENIPSSSSQVVIANRVDHQLKLASTLTDILGDELAPDIDYVLAYIIMKDGTRFLNSRTRTFNMTNQHILIGKYTGSWSDNLFTNLSISTEIDMANLRVSGSFYVSQNFSSCCGGENDGDIRLTLEKDVITSFAYSQDLVLFQGGPCKGTYVGNGHVINDINGIRLDIALEGSDCEGDHTDGRISLKRIQ